MPRIFVRTDAKARRDGANASFFRLPAHPAGALSRLSPAECEPYTHLQQTHTALWTTRTQRATS